MIVSNTPDETETRQNLIDGQLNQAGWSVDRRNLLEEILLTDSQDQSRDPRGGYQSGNQYADYVLLGRDGKPIAIVEAKRSSRDALAGKRQASDYADLALKRYGLDPYIFLSNGETIWFWDRKHYPLRQISGFYNREDLERLAFQRQYRQPLAHETENLLGIDEMFTELPGDPEEATAKISQEQQPKILDLYERCVEQGEASAAAAVANANTASQKRAAADTEISVLKKRSGDGTVYMESAGMDSFGASPTEIMRGIFGAQDSVGQRAAQFLDLVLAVAAHPDQVERVWNMNGNTDEIRTSADFQMLWGVVKVLPHHYESEDRLLDALNSVRGYAQEVEGKTERGPGRKAICARIWSGRFNIAETIRRRRSKSSPRSTTTWNSMRN